MNIIHTQEVLSSIVLLVMCISTDTFHKSVKGLSDTEQKMSNQVCQTCKTTYTNEQQGGFTYRMQGDIIYCRVCTPNATPNNSQSIFDLCWSNGDEMAFLDEESLNVLIETLRECLAHVLPTTAEKVGKIMKDCVDMREKLVQQQTKRRNP